MGAAYIGDGSYVGLFPGVPLPPGATVTITPNNPGVAVVQAGMVAVGSLFGLGALVAGGLGLLNAVETGGGTSRGGVGPAPIVQVPDPNATSATNSNLPLYLVLGVAAYAVLKD